MLKITKYCNLRCSYCYEFPELGNKHVVPLDKFERLFRNISLPHLTNPRPSEDKDVSFIWHGGEPFMVPMSYYRQIGDLQKSIIADRFSYTNYVQTNLTILTDEHVEELAARRFFQHVGFSFDVYGDQRVDLRGSVPTAKVLRNVQKLLDHDIPTGAIVVLSRSTAPHMERIFRFYSSLGLSVRLLPYQIERSRPQTELNGLHPDEIVTSMCAIFDLWLQSDAPVPVPPLDEYIDAALAYMMRGEDYRYDKWADEHVFIVDTNGHVYGFESYLGEERYGNLFDQPFEEILGSDTRMKLAGKAAERMERHCASCRYFGACTGYPVAEATPFEQQWLEAVGCYVAKIITHIVDRFDHTDISATIVADRRARLRGGARAAS